MVLTTGEGQTAVAVEQSIPSHNAAERTVGSQTEQRRLGLEREAQGGTLACMRTPFVVIYCCWSSALYHSYHSQHLIALHRHRPPLLFPVYSRHLVLCLVNRGLVGVVLQQPVCEPPGGEAAAGVPGNSFKKRRLRVDTQLPANAAVTTCLGYSAAAAL